MRQVLRGTGREPAAVDRVTDQRVAAMREMHANLVYDRLERTSI